MKVSSIGNGNGNCFTEVGGTGLGNKKNSQTSDPGGVGVDGGEMMTISMRKIKEIGSFQLLKKMLWRILHIRFSS